MKQKLKQITSFLRGLVTSSNPQQSLHKIAVSNNLDRRASTRICYPSSGPVGWLPQISYQGTPLEVRDISLGGVCLMCFKRVFDPEPGSMVQLFFQWPSFETSVNGSIVAAEQDRVHIAFQHVSSKAKACLHFHVRVAYVAQKMSNIVPSHTAGAYLGAEEMWLGPSGESLVFYDQHSLTAELTLFGRTFQVRSGNQIIIKSMQEESHEVSYSNFNDIIVFLANIHSPTERVKALLDHLQQQKYSSTG